MMYLDILTSAAKN